MVFLSVVIAAYNSEKTLNETLRSLAAALDSATGAEVVIINDSSTDKTQDIIDQWRNCLPNLITDQVMYRNIGKVRSHAVSLSHGQYIMMLDSDDLLKPKSLRDAIDFLVDNQPDMLITHLLEIHDRSKISPVWHGFTPRALSQQDAIRRFLIHKDFQAHLGGQFIHRKLYIRTPIPPISCYEDFAVFPSMLMHADKIYYQKHGHYYYIKNKTSLSSTIDSTKINYLVDCTLNMEQLFPVKFRHLINCHWFDIYTNYKQVLSSAQLELVKQRIDELYSTGFFLTKDVRLSYKKRVITTLWKK